MSNWVVKAEEEYLTKKILSGYLDDRREAFCRNIVARMGLVDSYLASIDSSAKREAAKEQAMILVNTPEVCERITELEKERTICRNITKESLLAGMKKIYDVSAVDYYENDIATLKSPSSWTPEMRVAVKRIKPGKFGTEIEMQSKDFLMDKIIKLSGIEPHPVAQSSNVSMDQYSYEELRKLAAEDVSYEEVS